MLLIIILNLLFDRRSEPLKNFSFLILAGGKSSRMGKNKADLSFKGQTFLEILINKAKKMGFTDILVSGYPNEILSLQPIIDEFPGRGPLGGLYSSFKMARHPFAFVVSVDVPLLNNETILALIDYHHSHDNFITLLSQEGKIEPLIGIYPTASYQKMESLIKNGPARVFDLINLYDYGVFDNSGEIIDNINTPRDYARIIEENSDQ